VSVPSSPSRLSSDTSLLLWSFFAPDAPYEVVVAVEQDVEVEDDGVVVVGGKCVRSV
jgi:hypothetical protein